MKIKKAKPTVGVSSLSNEKEVRFQRTPIGSPAELNETYAAILESIDAIVYVCDMENHEVIYINNAAREIFGSVEGQICWQVFQDQPNGPCDFCTNKMIVSSDGSLSGHYIWEHRNPLTGRWYKLYDQAVAWHNGRHVRLEIAVDITEHKETQVSLASREALLATFSFAARQFFVTPLWEESVQEFLTQLGQALNASRVSLIQFTGGASGEKISSPQYGWAAPGVSSVMDNPKLHNFNPFVAGLGRVRQILESGEIFSFETSKLNGEERVFFQSLDIQSAVFLPIMIDGRAWGIICLEDTQDERSWTTVEIKVLHTTASLLGCAIKKQQTEQQFTTEKLLYRAVLNDQPELICRFGPDALLTFANKSCCRFFGKKETDLIGSSFYELFPEKERIHVRNHVASLSAENSVATIVIRIVTDDRKSCWHQWTDQVFHDHQGNVCGYQATGRDITKEKQEKEVLSKNHQALEILVRKRTAELIRINTQLKVEVAERQRAARDLEEANIALRVMLHQSADAKKELEEKVQANINELICPSLNELAIHLKEGREKAYLEVVRNNLQQITSSFSYKIKTHYFPLTPREIQVADLIRQGRTNKEIAEILFLSPRTVETYRDKLRKKLGLRNKKVNLSSFLNTL